MDAEKLVLRRLVQAQKLLKEADEVMPPPFASWTSDDQDAMASDVRFALRTVTVAIQNCYARKAKDESRRP